MEWYGTVWYGSMAWHGSAGLATYVKRNQEKSRQIPTLTREVRTIRSVPGHVDGGEVERAETHPLPLRRQRFSLHICGALKQSGTAISETFQVRPGDS